MGRAHLLLASQRKHSSFECDDIDSLRCHRIWIRKIDRQSFAKPEGRVGAGLWLDQQVQEFVTKGRVKCMRALEGADRLEMNHVSESAGGYPARRAGGVAIN